MAPIYLRALADVPYDLLDEALLRVEQRCKYFPKPVEITEHIQAKLDRRYATYRRLETMLAVAKWPEPEIQVTPEEKRAALKVYQDFIGKQGREA